MGKDDGMKADLVVTIVVLLFVFYVIGGLERVDCAMGVSSACDRIDTWYAKTNTVGVP